MAKSRDQRSPKLSPRLSPKLFPKILQPKEKIIWPVDPPAQKDGLILSVNAGSSSLKISLYRLIKSPPPSPSQSSLPPPAEPVELLLVSNITSISLPPASFSFDLSPTSTQWSLSQVDSAKVKKQPVEKIRDHATAFAHFLNHLQEAVGIEREQIVHVCHRVVHGGDYFEPVVINEERYHHIEKLSDLAPLHNGAALSVIQACLIAMPTANSIAYFDTSFHRTIPCHIASYAIDQTIAKKRGLKKYGFHGLSYAFILREVTRYLQQDPSTVNFIVLHLGSGASACCIQYGKSLDTSMGLTPLNGLPGATRSGAIDPSLIFHYTNKAGRMSHDRSQAVDVPVTLAEDILNRRSGWKSLTGTTEFGDIVKHMKEVEERKEKGEHVEEDEEKWKLAFELFRDRILNYVGSYYLKLQGQVDALVFSGGIGERSVELREGIVERMKCLGFAIDKEKNRGVDGVDGVVIQVGDGDGDGRRKVLVCRTDEQLEMARQCSLEKTFWVQQEQDQQFES